MTGGRMGRWGGTPGIPSPKLCISISNTTPTLQLISVQKLGKY